MKFLKSFWCYFTCLICLVSNVHSAVGRFKNVSFKTPLSISPAFQSFGAAIQDQENELVLNLDKFIVLNDKTARYFNIISTLVHKRHELMNKAQLNSIDMQDIRQIVIAMKQNIYDVVYGLATVDKLSVEQQFDEMKEFQKILNSLYAICWQALSNSRIQSLQELSKMMEGLDNNPFFPRSLILQILIYTENLIGQVDGLTLTDYDLQLLSLAALVTYCKIIFF